MRSIKRMAGVTILEAIIGIAMMSTVIIVSGGLLTDWMKVQNNQKVASQIKLHVDALANYISNNPSAITAATATTPVLLLPATYASGSGLTGGLSGTLSGYNLSICALVLNPSPGVYTSLIVTEPTTNVASPKLIDDGTLSSVVTALGSTSAAVFSTSANTTTLQGGKPASYAANNTLSLQWATTFGQANNLGQHCDGTAGSVNLARGTIHYFAPIASSSIVVNQAVLYRNAVAGQPQLNQMNTPIVMNSTQTAGAACTSTGAIAQNTNQTGLVMCGSNGVWNIVGEVVSGIAPGGSCSVTGQSGTTTGGVRYLCNGYYWVAMQNFANPGSACTQTGEQAISIPTGESLLCKNNVYIKLASIISKNIVISQQVVTDNVTIVKPTCDAGGTPVYDYEMIQTSMDVGVIPARQFMYLGAIDNGPTWTSVIRVKDQNGGDFSASYLNVQAIFKLECSY